MLSRGNSRIVRYCSGTLATALAGVLLAAGAQAGADIAVGPKSGLPVPRFVSLKPDRVNVRGGPTREHEVTFVYTRAGLPVEITAESDNWRRIRDWEGSEGWVYHSLLSGKRTVVVLPKNKSELVPLYAADNAEGAIIAEVQGGVIASVKRCTGTWCRVAGAGFDGWAVQDKLWGVYLNEKIE
jgi:SH3-like domain-containing protein